MIKAPWTFEQVVALQVWQDNDFVHPFTCGNRDGHPDIHGDHGILVPTIGGWICQCCDYVQDWAHEHMFGPAPTNPLAVLSTTPPPDRAQITEEITKAMVEAGARKHVIVLAELDKGRGFYVPGNPTLDKFSPELRADSLTAMRAALEAALAAREAQKGKGNE